MVMVAVDGTPLPPGLPAAGTTRRSARRRHYHQARQQSCPPAGSVPGLANEQPAAQRPDTESQAERRTSAVGYGAAASPTSQSRTAWRRRKGQHAAHVKRLASDTACHAAVPPSNRYDAAAGVAAARLDQTTSANMSAECPAAARLGCDVAGTPRERCGDESIEPQRGRRAPAHLLPGEQDDAEVAIAAPMRLRVEPIAEECDHEPDGEESGAGSSATTGRPACRASCRETAIRTGTRRSRRRTRRSAQAASAAAARKIPAAPPQRKSAALPARTGESRAVRA